MASGKQRDYLRDGEPKASVEQFRRAKCVGRAVQEQAPLVLLLSAVPAEQEQVGFPLVRDGGVRCIRHRRKHLRHQGRDNLSRMRPLSRARQRSPPWPALAAAPPPRSPPVRPSPLHSSPPAGSRSLCAHPLGQRIQLHANGMPQDQLTSSCGETRHTPRDQS